MSEETQNYLSEGELEDLLDELKGIQPVGVTNEVKQFLKHRAYLVGLIFSHTGIRREELVNLEWTHIDLSHRKVYIYDGKGGKDRQLGMPMRLADALSVYRDLDGRPNSPYVICTQDGNRMIGDNLGKMISKAANRAGIKPRRRVSPHDLRHTFSQLFQNQYGDTFLTQQALGHADVKTTQMYVSERKEEVIEAMQSFLSSDLSIEDKIDHVLQRLNKIERHITNDSPVLPDNEHGGGRQMDIAGPDLRRDVFGTLLPEGSRWDRPVQVYQKSKRFVWIYDPEDELLDSAHKETLHWR